MLIVLHKHAPERNLHRFYMLSLERNLFGEWSVIRHWGRIGAYGQQRTSWHDSLASAEDFFARTLREKRRRGYG
jgi:predicted DNA-binding WGR domain protein